MAGPVSYELRDGVATITMDDGKVNALSLDMLTEVGAALDRAEGDGAVVVLSGREGRFSAGFDLPVLRGGGPDALPMLLGGFELAERMLSFPLPIVVACSGHAIAMGVFLVLSGDYRIGARGPFKITANEVAIGMTLPSVAIEICRQRLAPAHFQRATILAEVFGPDDAVTAGFLDRVVPADELAEAARAVATEYTKLDLAAHAATKLAVRHETLQAMRAGLEGADAAFRSRG
jgi:enoyl-CoA hydratase